MRASFVGERSHLWRPARLAGRAGGRRILRPAPDRAADAGAGAARQACGGVGCRTDDGERLGDRAERARPRSFQAPIGRTSKWIADFTYVWTAEGWLYVAAVVDLFSRRVVGWSMKAEMTAQLVTDALVMAIWRRGKPGCAAASLRPGHANIPASSSRRLMADNGVACSMSRSGNVWDNAAMESFFSSLKTERTARKLYRTRDAGQGRRVRLHRALLQR